MTTPIFSTWEDYGCKANVSFDNGPPLTRMIDKMLSGQIPVAPVGRMGYYEVATTINWANAIGGALEGGGGFSYAHDNGRVGCTKLVWTGQSGKPVINYCGHGGRIGKLTICGGALSNQYPITAGHGIYVPSYLEPGSGNLVTDQLAIVQCNVGIECNQNPANNHADLMKHHNLLIHYVNDCYVVNGEQSCPHEIYSLDLRGIFKRGFVMHQGGGLSVYGLYAGGGTKDQNLLYIGKANDYVGNFSIDGLQLDGTVKNMTLVNHGQFAMKVRIKGGNVRKPDQIAKPMVIERDGFTEYADIKISLGKCRYRKYHSEW